MPERQLASFVSDTAYDGLPAQAKAVAKRVLLTTLSTAIAGAREDGIAQLRHLALQRGGAKEAHSLVFGDLLPAPSAALLNGVMCRALDYCDAVAPGLHIGSSLVPAVLAAAEIQNNSTGKDLISALVVGAEIGIRMNLSEQDYDGLDPTGIAGIFAATAGAARILRLDADQTLHALAMAFNRAGGSFQSNIDGSLTVRLIQGWVAEAGLNCALLAREGLTGPKHFMTGVYGFPYLFTKGRREPGSFVAGLGRDFHLDRIMFKKYPSCGLTQGATELALKAASDVALAPGTIAKLRVRLPPYAFKLVGHDFSLGDTPRVNAQFSVQYCIASAIVRRSAKLGHFRESAICDPVTLDLASRVQVEAAPELDRRGHTAVDLCIETTDGRSLDLALDIAPGFPGNALSAKEHEDRFWDCMDYAELSLPIPSAHELLYIIDHLEDQTSPRGIIQCVAPIPSLVQPK